MKADGEDKAVLQNLGMVLAWARNLPLIDRAGLYRAEFVLFEREDKALLSRFIEERKLRFSVHCPLFNPVDPPEHPLLACIMDADEKRRKYSLELIRTTMEDGASIGAEYAVVHLQRVSHFSEDDTGALDYRELIDALWRSCETLTLWSDELGIDVCVENLFDHSKFHEARSYVEVFRAFPRLSLCLDIGHLDMDSRIFGVDFDGFIDELLPYLRAVHLQNSKGGDFREGEKHWKAPVHESQDPLEGWRDIPSILRDIVGKKPDCIINFEAWPDYYPTIDYMIDGIGWARELYRRILEVTMRDGGS